MWFLALGCRPPGAHAQAQSDNGEEWVFLDSIHIEGNRRTRRQIILRELDMRSGDSLLLSELPDRLERNRLRVLNLGLFTNASAYIARWHSGNCLVVQIDVKEAWYTYPAPVFELADRNFNVWWHEFNRSLKRVNYGVNWFQMNLTGRRDVLRANASFGYANRYEVSYTTPAINKTQTLGALMGLSFSRLHELPLRTEADKPVFYTDPDSWLIERRHWNVGLIWRPRFFDLHTVELEYHRNSVTDYVAEAQPDFFLERYRRQRHFSIVYSFVSDHRDIRPYPLKGFYSQVDLRWNGLLPSDNLKLGRLRAEWRQYYSFKHKLSTELIGAARVSFPGQKIPYYNNQALGYGNDLVRGYEYYVADGLHFGLFKSALRWQLLDRSFQFGKIIPLESYRTFPLKIYLSAHNDLGYARDPYYALGNAMSNRVLWGYGVGIHVVAYYDKVARFEVSRNDLGQTGFYVNISTGF
jgi:outer membrane protein assembly factor BamA